LEGRFHHVWIVLAGILLLALPSAAQITIGDDLNLTASGSVSAGYSADYGNQISSDHGLGFGGSAALGGFFYNPNFLSFNVDPYYNQSRSNSGFGSVTNASGVALGSAIFNGSHFPGSVNYNTNYNTTGNYGLPGIASLNTNGNNQSFGIGWGAFVPGLPTLSVGYQMGSSNYSLYGTNENGSSDFKSFNVNSNYNIAGFGLGAGVSHGTSNALIPGVILGGQSETSSSESTSYVFSASHAMPWNGSFSSNFNRTDLNSDYLGYSFNGDIDLVSANVGLHPTNKLSFFLNSDYTDNLSGSLYEAIIPSTSGTASNQSTTSSTAGILGGTQNSPQQSSHAWDFLFATDYAFAKDLQVQGEFERREQAYLGENYGSNLYSAGVFYTRQIAGGYLGSSVNVIDSTVDNSNQNELGFNVNANYNRRIGQWSVGGYFSYAQNVATFLVAYTTSFYNFSGNVSRRFGSWYWSASAGGGRSGLTDEPGTSSSSETFGTSLGTRKFALSGNYSKSDGNSLASGGGLTSTPLPIIIPSSLLILYGGTSYSFSASTAPVRNFTAAASYVKAKDNLSNLGITSWNNYEQENAYLQYQFRQVGVNGGYARLVQGFSASGTAPASFSSFYIGVYRWFNFF
jgi:hypothetical protein